MQDRRITLRELADELGASIGSVHTNLTVDLGLRSVSAKFVPKLLTMEQKQLRLEIAQNMLDCVESDSNFLNTVITGEESWVYGYDPETNSQSSMETFIIAETKESTAGPQQRQGFVDRFSRLP